MSAAASLFNCFFVKVCLAALANVLFQFIYGEKASLFWEAIDLFPVPHRKLIFTECLRNSVKEDTKYTLYMNSLGKVLVFIEAILLQGGKLQLIASTS